MSNTGRHSTGYGSTGDYSTGDYSTGYWSTGDYSTGHRSTGNGSTGRHSTGNGSTGHCSTGYGSTGDYSTGNRSTGHRSTGHWSISSYSVGHFSTIDYSPFGCFDKPCTPEEWDNAIKPNCLYFDLTEWVIDSSLPCGGELKTYRYKEAFTRSMEKATPEEIEQIKALPNFDSQKFYEISGFMIKEY